MSNVTRLPPFPKSVHVEADIPISQRDEFERAIVEIVAGARPRLDALDRDVATIAHPTTGGAKRLVGFLAGVYNRQQYPFDRSELRGRDTELANADRDLHRGIEDYEITPRRGG